MKDVEQTLKKLPKKYCNLIKHYKFKFQPNNTLKGDNSHIGLIDDKKKEVLLAAPMFHGREFVLLHELAHIIWSHLISEELKTKWHKLAKPYLKQLDDTSEEVFCHIFANIYAQNPVIKYDVEKLKKFIEKIPH